MAIKDYTTAQAAKILKRHPRFVAHLIQTEQLKAEKLDPSIKNSPYVIKSSDLESYQQTRRRKVKRCEPCKHQPKKLCASCKQLICLRDYRIQAKTGMASAKCKNCENKRKRETKKTCGSGKKGMEKAAKARRT